MSIAVALVEAAAAAKHDLGKYVAFQIRWLAPDAPPEALLEALRSDVLQTRRGPTGIEDAPALWRRLRPPLAGLAPGDSNLASVDESVAALEAALPGLRAGDLTPTSLVETAAHARAVAAHLAALHRRLRSRVG